jgi:hypothetical protein
MPVLIPSAYPHDTKQLSDYPPDGQLPTGEVPYMCQLDFRGDGVPRNHRVTVTLFSQTTG